MKKLLVFLVILFILSLAGNVFAFDGEEAPPLFYLVAGSFQELENAEAQQEELYMYRYYSKIMGYPIDGVIYWRVVVAQDKKKENLAGLKALLKEEGFETFYACDSGNEPERPVHNPDPIPIPESERDIGEIIKERFETFDEFISWLRFALENY